MAQENEAVLLASAEDDAFAAERLEVERLIREVERLLSESRTLLDGTDFGVEAVRKAEQALIQVRAAIERHDRETLVASRESLLRTVSFLSTVRKRGGR